MLIVTNKTHNLFKVMLMGWDFLSELPPPIGLLFIPQMIYVSMDSWRNCTDKKKTKEIRKNLSQCWLVHQKSQMDWPKCKPGREDETREPCHGLSLLYAKLNLCYLRFQVLMATSTKFRVFWDVTPCSHVEVDRSFRDAYCLYYQGDE
jgi:hypothetical protein